MYTLQFYVEIWSLMLHIIGGGCKLYTFILWVIPPVGEMENLMSRQISLHNRIAVML